MRISRQQLLLGILVALVLGTVVFAFATQTTPPSPTPVESTESSGTPAQTDAENESSAPAEEPRTAIVREDGDTAARIAATQVAATATLVVDGTRYPLTAPEGTTLKEAMDRLQGESGFTYTYRTYAGLGAFVTHINGRASTGDQVWILHVNGEKSGAGISSTRIRSGDVIEWKLEESY